MTNNAKLKNDLLELYGTEPPDAEYITFIFPFDVDSIKSVLKKMAVAYENEGRLILTGKEIAALRRLLSNIQRIEA